MAWNDPHWALAAREIPTVTANTIEQQVTKIVKTSIHFPGTYSTPFPNHAIARSLTSHILNYIPLPKNLTSWASFVKMPQDYRYPISGVVGAGFGAGCFFYQMYRIYDNRKRIQMVIAFAVQKVLMSKELQALLDKPDELLAKLQKDIDAFVGAKIITEAGKEAVQSRLKRSAVLAVEKSRKRQRTSPDEEEVEEEDVDISMPDAPDLSPLPESSPTEPRQIRSPVSPDNGVERVQYPRLQSLSNQETSHPQVGAPMLPKKTETVPSPGTYGFSYDDYSSSSEEASPLAARRQPLVDRAVEDSFNALASDIEDRRNRLLGIKRPQAVKPKNPFPSTPPTALARASGNLIVGTNLSPVFEGSSDVSSVDETKTQYRVAGTRKFYGATNSGKTAKHQHSIARFFLARRDRSSTHASEQSPSKEHDEIEQEETEDKEEQNETGPENAKDEEKENIEIKQEETGYHEEKRAYHRLELEVAEEDEDDREQPPVPPVLFPALPDDTPRVPRSKSSKDLTASRRVNPKLSQRIVTPHPRKARRSLSAESPARRSSRKNAYKGNWQR